MNKWWNQMNKSKDEKMTYNEACWIIDKHGEDIFHISSIDDMIYRAKLTKGLYESEIKDPKD